MPFFLRVEIEEGGSWDNNEEGELLGLTFGPPYPRVHSVKGAQSEGTVSRPVSSFYYLFFPFFSVLEDKRVK